MNDPCPHHTQNPGKETESTKDQNIRAGWIKLERTEHKIVLLVRLGIGQGGQGGYLSGRHSYPDLKVRRSRPWEN